MSHALNELHAFLYCWNLRIFFKKDFLQYTGSFKDRGARYALQTLNEVNLNYSDLE